MGLVSYFAVHPGAVSRYADFKYVFEKFGFSRGAMAVRYPRDWVGELLSLCGDSIDRKKIEVWLSKYGDESIFFDAPPHFRGEWSAVIRELHAHLSRQGPGLGGVLVEDFSQFQFSPPRVEIASDCARDFFPTENMASIKREARVIAESARDLLRISARVVLIDRHFNPFGGAFLESLRHVLLVAISEKTSFVEILVSDSRLPKNIEDLDSKISRLFPERPGLPKLTILFVRDDFFFHDRYLIGEKGGLLFAAGAGAVHDDDDVQTVALLSPQVHADLKARFYSDAIRKKKIVAKREWPAPRRCFRF